MRMGDPKKGLGCVCCTCGSDDCNWQSISLLMNNKRVTSGLVCVQAFSSGSNLQTKTCNKKVFVADVAGIKGTMQVALYFFEIMIKIQECLYLYLCYATWAKTCTCILWWYSGFLMWITGRKMDKNITWLKHVCPWVLEYFWSREDRITKEQENSFPVHLVFLGNRSNDLVFIPKNMYMHTLCLNFFKTRFLG